MQIVKCFCMVKFWPQMEEEIGNFPHGAVVDRWLKLRLIIFDSGKRSTQPRSNFFTVQEWLALLVNE